MFIRNKIYLLLIVSTLLLFLLLTGCLGSPKDETQIMQIAENIEKTIQEKDYPRKRRRFIYGKYFLRLF